jgi:ribonuclease D
MPDPVTPPNKEEIAELEPFVGLGVQSIFVITTRYEAEAARDELLAHSTVGFDTESRPTFRKGQQSEGPHVLQFATRHIAYLFQAHITKSHPALIELLQSESMSKIGFGLKGDLSQISGKFGIRPNSVVDLDRSFRKLGYHNSIGAKTAVALLFGKRFSKPKSITTSDWSNRKLSERQILYAANDAYAAIRVFDELHASERREEGHGHPEG